MFTRFRASTAGSKRVRPPKPRRAPVQPPRTRNNSATSADEKDEQDSGSAPRLAAIRTTVPLGTAVPLYPTFAAENYEAGSQSVTLDELDSILAGYATTAALNSKVSIGGDSIGQELDIGTTDNEALALEADGVQLLKLENATGVTVQNGPLNVAGGNSLALQGATSGTAALKAAATTTSYTVTMPSAQGSSGQTLVNDGSGNLAWAVGAAPGGTSGQLQFNNSGAFDGLDDSKVDNTPGAPKLGIGTASPQAVIDVSQSFVTTPTLFSAVLTPEPVLSPPSYSASVVYPADVGPTPMVDTPVSVGAGPGYPADDSYPVNYNVFAYINVPGEGLVWGPSSPGTASPTIPYDPGNNYTIGVSWGASTRTDGSPVDGYIISCMPQGGPYSGEQTFYTVDASTFSLVDDHTGSTGSVNVFSSTLTNSSYEFNAYSSAVAPDGTSYFCDTPTYQSVSNPGAPNGVWILHTASEAIRILQTGAGGYDMSAAGTYVQKDYLSGSTSVPAHFGWQSDGSTLSLAYQLYTTDGDPGGIYSATSLSSSTSDPNDGLWYYVQMTADALPYKKIVRTTGWPVAQIVATGVSSAFDTLNVNWGASTTVTPTSIPATAGRFTNSNQALVAAAYPTVVVQSDAASGVPSISFQQSGTERGVIAYDALSGNNCMKVFTSSGSNGLDLGVKKLINVDTCVNPLDAANKTYVDTAVTSLTTSSPWIFLSGAPNVVVMRPTGVGTQTAFSATHMTSTEGAGSRLMWEPVKSSVRGGFASGTQWDSSNRGQYSTAFGYNTIASGNYCVALGSGSVASQTGAGVLSGENNSATGYDCVVAGGVSNTASGTAAVVCGGGGTGNGNSASGSCAGILTGQKNTCIATNGVVAGGNVNYNAGSNSFLGCGSSNTISSGGQNAALCGGSGNTASGLYSFVGAGNTCSASGQYGVCAGGFTNTCAGTAACVPGGAGNDAPANYSFAAGQYAKVQPSHNNAFVLSDGTNNTNSFGPNSLTARFSNGVYFYSNTTGSTGVQLTASAASWSSISDRNAKERIVEVDCVDMLRAVEERMPVYRYNYKGAPEENVCIGPMAQDFHLVHASGKDQLRIEHMDLAGVTLAAVRGLTQLVRALEMRCDALEAQNTDLAARLAEIEGGSDSPAPHSDSESYSVRPNF